AVLDGFESHVELPGLEEGRHHELFVDEEGMVFVRPGQGEIGLLRLEANPPVLMRHFAERLAELRVMGGALLPLTMSRHGIDAEGVNRLLDTAFEFPHQVDHLSLSVDGSEAAGFEVALDLRPAGGSGFDGFVAALLPNSLGAPELDADSAVIRLRGSLDRDSLEGAFRPIVEISTSLYPQMREDAEAFDAYMEKWLEIMDGTFAMTSALGSPSRSVVGTRDVKAAGGLLASEEYRRFSELGLERNPELEGEVTLNAFEHRGISVSHQKAEILSDTLAQNPLFASEQLNTYMAAAGDCIVASMLGGTEEDVKALIDLALDGKIARSPLAHGAVLEMTVDLASVIGRAGTTTSQDMPQEASLSVSGTGGRFRMRITVK
ncbi:MAG: hypothetical protein V2A76_00665, partial [Planctomycetota bacterium]